MWIKGSMVHSLKLYDTVLTLLLVKTVLTSYFSTVKPRLVAKRPHHWSDWSMVDEEGLFSITIQILKSFSHCVNMGRAFSLSGSPSSNNRDFKFCRGCLFKQCVRDRQGGKEECVFGVLLKIMFLWGLPACHTPLTTQPHAVSDGMPNVEIQL